MSPQTIPDTLHALLEHLIDYAGLFPPAQLPFEAALKQYVAYQHHADCWMLGPFICPTRKLDTLVAQQSDWQEVSPFRVALLPPPLTTPKTAVQEFRQSLSEAQTLLAPLENALTPQWIEIKFPDALLQQISVSSRLEFLTECAGILQETLPSCKTIFWEIRRQGPWYRTLDQFMEAAALYQETRKAETPTTSFKIRCGGLSPADFPTSEEVATAIVLGREAAVCFKATAGLHQPFRYFDGEMGVFRHGFINLFTAAILSNTYRLSIQEVIPVLEDNDPEHFSFEQNRLHWEHLHAPKKQVVYTRKELAHSFGSCSFDEPREALRTYGLLPPEKAVA